MSALSVPLARSRKPSWILHAPMAAQFSRARAARPWPSPILTAALRTSSTVMRCFGRIKAQTALMTTSMGPISRPLKRARATPT
eukprot:2310337-Lingulodinium_polyedra.AAC.1